jgi:hypothetical protein
VEAGDSKTKKKQQVGPQQFAHEEAAASASASAAEAAARAKEATATPEQIKTNRATEPGALALARSATPLTPEEVKTQKKNEPLQIAAATPALDTGALRSTTPTVAEGLKHSAPTITGADTGATKHDTPVQTAKHDTPTPTTVPARVGDATAVKQETPAQPPKHETPAQSPKHETPAPPPVQPRTVDTPAVKHEAPVQTAKHEAPTVPTVLAGAADNTGKHETPLQPAKHDIPTLAQAPSRAADNTAPKMESIARSTDAAGHKLETPTPAATPTHVATTAGPRPVETQVAPPARGIEPQAPRSPEIGSPAPALARAAEPQSLKQHFDVASAAPPLSRAAEPQSLKQHSDVASAAPPLSRAAEPQSLKQHSDVASAAPPLSRAAEPQTLRQHSDVASATSALSRATEPLSPAHQAAPVHVAGSENQNLGHQAPTNITPVESLSRSLTAHGAPGEGVTHPATHVASGEGVALPAARVGSGEGAIQESKARLASGEGAIRATTPLASGEGNTHPTTHIAPGDGSTHPTTHIASGDGSTHPTTHIASGDGSTHPTTHIASGDGSTHPTTHIASGDGSTYPTTHIASGDGSTHPTTHIASGDGVTHDPRTHVASVEPQILNHPTTFARATESAESHAPVHSQVAELQNLNHASSARATEVAVENHAVALARKDDLTSQSSTLAAAGLEGRRGNFEGRGNLEGKGNSEGLRQAQTAGLNTVATNQLTTEGPKNDARTSVTETLSRSQTIDNGGSAKWESALNQMRQEREVPNFKGEKVNLTQTALNEKVVQNSRLEAAQVQSIEKGLNNKIETQLNIPTRELTTRVENVTTTPQVKDSPASNRPELVPVQIPIRRETQDTSKSDTNETKTTISNQTGSSSGSSSTSSQNQAQNNGINGTTDPTANSYGSTQKQDPSTSSYGTTQTQDPSTNSYGTTQTQDPSTNSYGTTQTQDPSANGYGSTQSQDPSNTANQGTSQDPTVTTYGSTQTQDPTINNYGATPSQDPAPNNDPGITSQQPNSTSNNNNDATTDAGQLFPWSIGYDPSQTNSVTGTFDNNSTFTPSIAPIDPFIVNVPLDSDPGVPALQNLDDSTMDFSVQPAIAIADFTPEATEVQNVESHHSHAHTHYVHTAHHTDTNEPIEALATDRKEISENVDTSYIPYGENNDLQEQILADRKEVAVQLENDYRAEKAAREDAEKEQKRNEEVRRLTDTSLTAMSTKQQQQLEADRLAHLARRQQQLDAEKLAQVVKRQQQLAEETKQEKYIVKKHDSLESIAAKKLGATNLSTLIYEMNKGRIPTETSEDGSVIYILRVGTILLLPSRVQVRAYKQRQLLQSAGATHAGFASNDSKIDSERRSNIEKYLGPITAPAAEENLTYIVRLGDSLRSVAVKHPALKDVNLWKLIAKINELPATTDSQGAPMAVLVRGTSLKLPNQAQIAKYRLTVTGNNLALLQPNKNLEGKTELAAVPCHSCNRLITPSCAICPGCASKNAFHSFDPENRDTTLSMKTPSPALSNAAIVQETIIASKAYSLSETCRVTRTKVSKNEQELIRLELETYYESNWTTILSYEMSRDNTVRHEYFPNSAKRSIKIELPIFAAQEMIQNDLSVNWQSYISNYELMERLPA